MCYENSLCQIIYAIFVYDKFHVLKIHYDIVNSTIKCPILSFQKTKYEECTMIFLLKLRSLVYSNHTVIILYIPKITKLT